MEEQHSSEPDFPVERGGPPETGVSGKDPQHAQCWGQRERFEELVREFEDGLSCFPLREGRRVPLGLAGRIDELRAALFERVKDYEDAQGMLEWRFPRFDKDQWDLMVEGMRRAEARRRELESAEGATDDPEEESEALGILEYFPEDGFEPLAKWMLSSAEREILKRPDRWNGFAEAEFESRALWIHLAHDADSLWREVDRPETGRDLEKNSVGEADRRVQAQRGPLERAAGGGEVRRVFECPSEEGDSS